MKHKNRRQSQHSRARRSSPLANVWPWILGLALAAGGGAVYQLSNDFGERHEAAKLPPQTLSLEVGAGHTGSLPSRPHLAPTTAQRLSAEGPRASFGPKPIASLQDRLFEQVPEFGEIRLYSEKVLASASESARLRELLSDKALLGKWADYLKSAHETEVDQVGQLKRIYALNALSMAAQWQDNPAREELKDLLKEAFSKSMKRPEQSESLRRSLVADKFEMWRIIRKNFPEVAEDIKSNPADETWKTLIEKADQFAGHKT